jgi:cyclase
MLASRLVVCLDVTEGRVVKGVRFRELRDIGDPVEMAARYEQDGADEIVFLDISATVDNRDTLWSLIERTAQRLFIPLTVGGGLRSTEDALRALGAGADKVALNSAAVDRPQTITEIAERLGRQCVVVSMDVAEIDSEWRVVTRGGKTVTPRRAVEWARECESRGAGEIVLTSIDRDGARTGYDLELTSAIASAVNIPVVASGGAGAPQHIVDVFQRTNAQAALVAGVLHDGIFTVADIKGAMSKAGLLVRAA